jgi:hypothetical protein
MKLGSGIGGEECHGKRRRNIQDSLGGLIDGDHNGTPGGNAVASLRHSGATISSLIVILSAKTQLIEPNAVDHLLERVLNPRSPKACRRADDKLVRIRRSDLGEEA